MGMVLEETGGRRSVATYVPMRPRKASQCVLAAGCGFYDHAVC